MIFQLCQNVGVPIWHIDVLHIPEKMVVIDPIKDEANEVAPLKGPTVDVQPLGDNLADTLELAQGADHATSWPTDIAPFEFVPESCRDSSSSRSTPP